MNNDFYRKYDSYQLNHEVHFGFPKDEAVLTLLDVRDPLSNIVTKLVKCLYSIDWHLNLSISTVKTRNPDTLSSIVSNTISSKTLTLFPSSIWLMHTKTVRVIRNQERSSLAVRRGAVWLEQFEYWKPLLWRSSGKCLMFSFLKEWVWSL